MRVLVLMHKDLVPPDSLDGLSEKEELDIATEFDVMEGLRTLGHDVRALGVSEDLGKIRDMIVEWKPHVAFNLLEEFHGVAVYDQHVVSYLELMKQPYTGCNPRGLMLSHDKGLSKQILTYHRIPTPRFQLFPRGRRVQPPKRLRYPILVKSSIEEASLGISQASLVPTPEKLKERVEFVHEQLETDALAEEYIVGRELYLGVIGNQRLATFPVWEMLFKNVPEGTPKFATAKVKWDPNYQRKLGIETARAEGIPAPIVEKIARTGKRIYKTLSLSGYARIDLRLTEDNEIYVLEANPNPYLANGEDFAESASAAGLDYNALLQRILQLGRSYKAAWRV